MKRFEKIKNALTKGPMEDFFLRNIGGTFGTDAEILDKAYSKSDLVYICISTTARAISQVPMQLGRVNPRTDEWEAVSGNQTPWQEVIQNPNYLQDYSTFIQSIVSYLMLDGDCWIVPFPLLEDGPFSLWSIREEFMEPVRDKENGMLQGWRYIPSPTKSTILDIGEVAHVFFWNPDDPIMGFAPLEAGQLSIVTDYKAAKFNQLFFDQGAEVGGVLSAEGGLTERQHQRLEKQMQEKYMGFEKAHKIMVLEGGLKYSSTLPTHKDMRFTDLRKLDKERILQVFGMKKAVISVTDDLNYATAKEQRKSWWQDTNLPIMRMITEALNFTFFSREDLEVRFDISGIEALQEDFKDKVTTAKALTEMGFTANEVNERLELGFDSQPWRDYFYLGAGMKPIGADSPAVPDEEEPPELPPPPVPPQLPAPSDDDDDEEEESIVIPKIELKVDFDSRGGKVWKDLLNRIRPTEKLYKDKTKRMFYEWRKLVLDWFYDQAKKSLKQDAEPFILSSPLTDIDELGIEPLDNLKDAADALYEESLMQGLVTIGLEIGEVLDIDILALPAASEFLTNKSIAIKGLGETQAKKLRRSLMRGMENGESLEELADRIRYTFTTAANRARTIARTEVFGALNAGRNMTVKETGYKQVQWFTSLDERVRDTHKIMHGRKKEVNAMWRVGRSNLRWPGDPKGSAEEIINCRCIEMVVLESLEV